jgi:hypothetical protein
MSRRKLICVFVALLSLPAVTLAWLGTRLLSLDHALDAQRQSESREQAADRAVHALSAMVSDPSLTAREPANGALLAVFPGGKLLFQSHPAAMREAPAGVFAAAELLEIGKKSEAAAEEYRKLAQSSDRLVRAGALLRLARTLRNSKYPDEALRVYGDLERMGAAGAGAGPRS